jgi:hypothetical protein
MANRISFLIVLLLAAIFSITMAAAYSQAAYAQGGGMMKTTSKGSLGIRLEPTWSAGGQASFKVTFLNPGTDTPHQHQDYDFRILKDGQDVFSAANKTGQQVVHTAESSITVPYAFQGNGNYTVQVYLAGIGPPGTSIPTSEEATFPITVAPEFPAGVLAAAAMATFMTAAIVLAQKCKLF